MKLLEFMNNESGATAMEYGLLAALIAVSISVSVYWLGDQIRTLFLSLAWHAEEPGYRYR